MLERRLFRRKSNGEVIDRSWLQFFVPDLVALRRPPRAGPPARCRGHRELGELPGEQVCCSVFRHRGSGSERQKTAEREGANQS